MSETGFEKCTHCISDGGQAWWHSRCGKCSSNPNYHDKFQSNDPASEELCRTLTKDSNCTFKEIGGKERSGKFVGFTRCTFDE